MRASDIIKWIESELRLTHGPKAGEKFKLLPWQKAFVKGAFRARTSKAALSLPRGPGKTTLLAALAAAAVKGPLAIDRGEIVFVAASLEQARIAFSDVKAFLGVKGPKRGLWRVHDSTTRVMLEHLPSGSKVYCLSSNPKTAHGRRPGPLAILDEPAQWGTTADEMYAAIRTGMGKTDNARLIAIGTRPESQSHFFSTLLEDADFSLCYAAEPTTDPLSPAALTQAYPSLRQLPALRREVLDEQRKAARDPALLAQFRALRLNQGTSDTVVLHLLSPEEWQAAEDVAAAKSGPCYWGIDLGTTAAMSAIASYWPQTGRLEAVAAFPSNPSLSERERKDGVAKGLYQAMVDRGELLLLGDNVVPVGGLVAAAAANFGNPEGIAADRWRVGELKDALTEAAVLASIIARGMGWKDGAEDVRDFKTAFLNGRVRPRSSLLLRAAMAETRLMSDPAGNHKIAKAGEGSRRRNGRDDPAVAAVLGVGVAERLHRKPRRAAPKMGYIPIDVL